MLKKEKDKGELKIGEKDQGLHHNWVKAIVWTWEAFNSSPPVKKKYTFWEHIWYSHGLCL